MDSHTLLAPVHHVGSILNSVTQGVRANVLMQTVASTEYDGLTVDVDGRSLRNFGTCSYLGLEQRAELKEAAIEAVMKYGTQFAYSRAYLECPLYPELESLLDEITGGHTLVSPTTTLGHIAAIPTVIAPGDAVLVDKSTHASVHTALALLRGVEVVALPHGRLDAVESGIHRLKDKCRRIWYLVDGLYSMLGDFAPIDEIGAMMEKYPQLHLYVDDAHSTSWTGTHGRGHALERLKNRERAVVVLSMAKAFSAGGGVLVFADPALRDQVRYCGGPMLFSGPLQPATLGAAVASAKLHLQPNFANLQRDLLIRINHVIELSKRFGVRLADQDPTPIFFVPCGPVEKTFDLVLKLRERGFFVTTGMFPAVPHNKSGPRFGVAAQTSLRDIQEFLAAMAEIRLDGASSDVPTAGAQPVTQIDHDAAVAALHPSE